MNVWKCIATVLRLLPSEDRFKGLVCILVAIAVMFVGAVYAMGNAPSAIGAPVFRWIAKATGT